MKNQFFTIMLLSAFLLSCNNEIAEFRHTVFSSPCQEFNYSYKKLMRSFKKRMGRNEIEKPIEQLPSLDSIWLKSYFGMTKDTNTILIDNSNYSDCAFLATSCSKEHYLNASNHLSNKRHDIQLKKYKDTYQLYEIYNENPSKFEYEYVSHINNVNKDYKKISIPGVFAEISVVKGTDYDERFYVQLTIKTQKGVSISSLEGSGSHVLPLKYIEFKDYGLLLLPFYYNDMAGSTENVIVIDNIMFLSSSYPDFVSDEHYLVLSQYKKAFPNFFYFFPEVCVYDRSSYKVLDTNLDKIIFALTDHEYTPVFNEVVVNRISESYLPEYRNKYNGEICLEFDAEKNSRWENFEPNNQSIRIDTTFYYSILF